MSDDFVYALAQLTENKLFASVVPVLLGAGLLAFWLRIRDSRMALRDESLKFVNETADCLNRAISPLFGAIRRRSVERFEVIDRSIGELFEHRLSTRAKSVALLNAPAFWREYEDITWELRACVDDLRKRSGPNSPIIGNDLSDTVWDAAFKRAQVVWRRCSSLITAGIIRALGGKSPQFPVTDRGARSVDDLRND